MFIVGADRAYGARDQRSLVNTFPFNAQGDDEHASAHHAHGEHHEHHEEPARSLTNSLGSRGSKQVLE